MRPLPFPTPKSILQQFGLRPKKSFGQNFLGDPNLVDRIAGQAIPGSRVIEIGAGIGALTVALLNRGHQVVAIERDRDLIPVLQQTLAEPIERRQLTLLEADAKTVDYGAILAENPGPWTLTGNLPYNLTGVLLQRATELAPLLSRAVFLVQLEVAQRLTSEADGDAYGALSVFAQAAFRVQRAFVVKRGAFVPQPNVDSAVVTFDTLTPPRAEETDTFRAVVSAAFHQRRKTLRNAWKGLGLSSEALEELATMASVSLDARGETLSVDDFARVSSQLDSVRRAPHAN
jgi:16S rRNA (adenine1518-N6/adenine1519-N6)-dimethyltransferase